MRSKLLMRLLGIRPANFATCQHCGANGFGATGWTNVCPTCEASPARRDWHDQMTAIHSEMRTEAARYGYSGSRIVLTPETRRQLEALGPTP